MSEETCKCIKEENNIHKLQKIISLCEKYIHLLPDKNEWFYLFDNNTPIFLIEKLIYIINLRFLTELDSISSDLWIEEHQKTEFPYAMDSSFKDYYENINGIQQLGLIETGSNLTYHIEGLTYGLSISERNLWFSFYNEYIASISIDELDYINKDPKKEIQKYLDHPEFLMTNYFSKVIEDDPDFIRSGYEYVDYMLSALESEFDHLFLIHRCDKLHDFLIWVEKNENRKNLPESKMLLEYIELYKKPMIDFYNINSYNYIRTEKYTYMCYIYCFDEISGHFSDGKYFYPSHFYVMVVIECLLKIITMKYY